MAYRVLSFLKEQKLVYMLVDEEEVIILPSRFLKYRTFSNVSPNTVRCDAFALSYYYGFLKVKELDVKAVSNMKYSEQKLHFADFLLWLQMGKHTTCNRITQNKTCNKYLRSVFGFYRYLAEEEVISPVKVLYMKNISYADSRGVMRHASAVGFKGFLREEEKPIKELSKEEIKELIAACTNERDRLLLLILAETGFRIGEVLGIRYTEDIDFEAKTVFVSFREDNENMARAKNAEYRMAKLSDETHAMLIKYINDNRELLEKGVYLFVKHKGSRCGHPLEVNDVYSMMRRLEKKTQIRAHPHQFRHYFAGERRKVGWDLNEIRYALGHRKIETTIKYLGEDNERLLEVMDAYYKENEPLYSISDFL